MTSHSNLHALTDDELLWGMLHPGTSYGDRAADELRRRLSSLRAEILAAEADRDRLAEAMEWYAEQRNYLPPAGVEPYDALMARDAFDDVGRPGARARAVLAIVSEARG